MDRERPDWEWFQHARDEVAAGNLDAAEQHAADALVAGHLWRVSLLLAPPLKPLRGRKRFEEVAAEARRRAEERHLQPSVLTAMPRRAGVAPLVLVLHGATGNAAIELERWRPATELGRGHHVSVEVIPRIGHGYPPDFAARLPGLLRP